MSLTRRALHRCSHPLAAALSLLVALAVTGPTAGAQPAEGRTVLVLDASGSMWQQIGDAHKITIARDVVGELLNTLPADRALGLWAYGHRRKGDCNDIEELVPAGVDNRERIRAAVKALNPKGKTPLSDAVERAAEALRYEEEEATVVLISDGRETCDRDPCAVADLLESAGVDFTAHVIGFDVSAPEDQAQLRCLAENTGGSFRMAEDAAGLKDALVEVTAAPELEPAPEPEPEPEPQAPEIALTAPDTAPTGSWVTIERSETIAGSDYVTIVPRNAKGEEVGNYRRARDGNPLDVRAPAEAGLYEVRYVLEEGREVLGRTPIELTETAITLTAPDTAATGSWVTIERSETVAGSDYVTIVPRDAKDEEVGNYRRARDGNPLDVRAPAEAGLYEVRYVLEEGREVLGRTPIELTETAITLTAPETAPAGARIEVGRNETVAGSDYITIVPMGTEDGELGKYSRARNGNPLTLAMPAEPGLYEIRYVLDEGRRVLGRSTLEVVPVSARIEAPAEVVAGAAIDITWEGPNRRKDRIELVPAGAPPDVEPIGQESTKGKDSIRLTTPQSAGEYSLRYRLGETGEIVTSVDLNVEEVAAALSAPETAAPGATITIGWSGPGGERDRIALAEPDQGAFQWLTAESIRTDEGEGVRLTVPNDPGTYELRYIDVANGVVLATTPIEVR